MMELLNLQNAVRPDKEIAITDMEGNEIVFSVPGNLATKYILQNMAAVKEMQKDPSNPDLMREAFRCIWEVFAIRQPDFSFDDFLSLPLSMTELAAIVRFIYISASPEEGEKKTE